MFQSSSLTYWQSIKNGYERGEASLGRANMGMVAGAAVGVAFLPLGLSLAGFSATGVVSGSLAAGVQSVLYGAGTTGAFSVAQSAGAVGVGYYVTVVGGATGHYVAKPKESLEQSLTVPLYFPNSFNSWIPSLVTRNIMIPLFQASNKF